MKYQTFKRHSDGGLVAFGRSTASIKRACQRADTVEVRILGTLTVVWLKGVFVTRAPLKPAEPASASSRCQG